MGEGVASTLACRLRQAAAGARNTCRLRKHILDEYCYQNLAGVCRRVSGSSFCRIMTSWFYTYTSVLPSVRSSVRQSLRLSFRCSSVWTGRSFVYPSTRLDRPSARPCHESVRPYVSPSVRSSVHPSVRLSVWIVRPFVLSSVRSFVRPSCQTSTYTGQFLSNHCGSL